MTVRWGILGCGDVVRRRVAQAIAEDPESRLVAACRRDESKLRQFCSAYQIERAYTSDADLIADGNIDAVYVATPVNLHQAQSVAAAQAGKHVLVEKPMAMTTAECDMMIRTSHDRGVKLGVAYYRRFYPVVAKIRAYIAAGTIGIVLSATAVTAARFAIPPGADGYWRVLPEAGGGGALMDIGSHRIDLFRHLFGEIADVKAFCGTMAANYNAEDCATIAMRFHCGIHGNLQCFFGTEVDPDEFTVTGTKGRIVAAPLNGGQLVLELGNERRVESHPPSENFNAPLIADFVAAIRDGRAPMITGADGRCTNEVIERAYQNARV